MEIPYLRILLFSLCFFSISAVNHVLAQDSSRANVVEEKTGISVKHNKTLASLYNEAVEWLRTPYRRGGMSRKGMDCSGLTATIYKNVFGIKLQRRSRDMSKIDVEDLSKDQLNPGDLVFFSTSRRSKGINHVGVYLGNNHFVHASISRGVIISNLDEPYYKRAWVKGGRVKEGSEIFENILEIETNYNDNHKIEEINSQPFLMSEVEILHSLNEQVKSARISNNVF